MSPATIDVFIGIEDFFIDTFFIDTYIVIFIEIRSHIKDKDKSIILIKSFKS